MFDRRLPAVAEMDHRYLAKFDGSEQASGRGSGVEEPGVTKSPKKTPYMHMTFFPLERRLDTAIWRALFASSVNQARQFVVHGWVKVNGKKMVHPSYQLNPGDMFSVDPERVMYATGARKKSKDSNEALEGVLEDTELTEQEGVTEETTAENEAKQKEAEDQAADGMTPLENAEGEDMVVNDAKNTRKALKDLLGRAKRILEDSKRDLSGKRQQELRDFSRTLKTTMSKAGGKNESTIGDTVDDFETALASIMTKIPGDLAASTLPSEGANDSTNSASLQDSTKSDEYQARRDAELLHAALERARANPMDSSKPYATPWRPRDFMSAFAFIPRYLEVNQNICSAVYLRHPVARPGLAEVPTPFSGETLGLAFNWYLRRR
nr:37s ribosomal protein nam9, mitochondrial [Quercus suber]